MGLPRTAVPIAAAVILAMAVLGVFFGVRRSSPADDLETIPVSLGSNARVANAQALPLAPPLDEERVRLIAREEAQALIAPRPARRAEPEAAEGPPPTGAAAVIVPPPSTAGPVIPAAPAVTPLSPDLR
jgi:hypothetical protein